METLRLSIARLRFFSGGQTFLGIPGVKMNNLTTMESCPVVAR